MKKSGKFLKKLEKMELRDGNYELFKGLNKYSSTEIYAVLQPKKKELN
jgi:hypothetical protein